MRLRDHVYQALRRRIVLNELEPGDALIELGLAQSLECSQGTVREALLRLQEDGLVLRNGHRGTSVTPLDPEEATEIVALRRRLETRAAPRATLNVGADDIEALHDLQRRMDAAAKVGDPYALLEFDTEFHMAIFRLSGFGALEQILERCILHSHRQKLWEPRHRRPLAATAARHRPLLEAIEARDGQGLANALGEHIDTIVDVAPERIAQ